MSCWLCRLRLVWLPPAHLFPVQSACPSHAWNNGIAFVPNGAAFKNSACDCFPDVSISIPAHPTPSFRIHFYRLSFPFTLTLAAFCSDISKAPNC